MKQICIKKSPLLKLLKDLKIRVSNCLIKNKHQALLQVQK